MSRLALFSSTPDIVAMFKDNWHSFRRSKTVSMCFAWDQVSFLLQNAQTGFVSIGGDMRLLTRLPVVLRLTTSGALPPLWITFHGIRKLGLCFSLNSVDEASCTEMVKPQSVLPSSHAYCFSCWFLFSEPFRADEAHFDRPLNRAVRNVDTDKMSLYKSKLFDAGGEVCREVCVHFVAQLHTCNTVAQPPTSSLHQDAGNWAQPIRQVSSVTSCCRSVDALLVRCSKPMDWSHVLPVTDHEDTEGEYRYGSTLSLTSALGEWLVSATPRPLYPREIWWSTAMKLCETKRDVLLPFRLTRSESWL
jgi:hypothetical protein